MAAGVLATSSGSIFLGDNLPTTVTVYTVPAGMSYAVVHIKYAVSTFAPGGFSQTLSLGIDGLTWDSATASGATEAKTSGSMSLILGTGESVTVTAQTDRPLGGTTNNSRTVFVSGYEVP